MKNLFARFSRTIANAIGTPYAFTGALLVVLLWAISGPLFGFSDTWQLVINTVTTVGTFLVVFLIQATQNRDSKAIHLKLDELIHVISKAREQLIDAEDLSEEELAQLDREFKRLREHTTTQPLESRK
jgi:low affinity Fe/Cu permease